MEPGRVNCLAVDSSETSETAFNWYVKNYHQKNDTLLIVHIHEVPQLPMMKVLSDAYCGDFYSVPHYFFPNNEQYRTQIKKSIEEAKAIVEKFKTFCVEKEIKFNEIVLDDNFKSPGYMICELAKKKAATVIVMGQRGLGAISRLFLGSTSDYVLHHSDVPVIVIPPTISSR
ncbi:uncharacterized protein LOC100215544 [Hydra vulgaris]|uniref:uncharacterized protein LOC100215544 n=1 Tax=Hydra vulgaris TaxID=6087 RepID=UPI00019274AB|nr:universal stress protein PHOS32-like [Hydra vulgaris]